MIKQILELLAIDDWYGVSKEIDIAKGKYRAVRSWSEAKKQIKRHRHGK
jgi:hypothetical protein